MPTLARLWHDNVTVSPMSKPPVRIIPVKSSPQRPGVMELPLASAAVPPGMIEDRLGRPLRDLRISVTDRCNFRCGYCMPRDVFGPDHAFLPRPELLSFEEIHRSASIFARLGVRKVRLTGGEPLLRRGLAELVSLLSGLRTPDGSPLELALTTNGALLKRMASSLRQAGLNRLTVSLDALDPEVFQLMADTDVPVTQVLEGIDAALAAGFTSVKVNMVVQRGRNEHQILPMVRHFRGRHVVLRFIEYMDVGHTNQWRLDQVVSWREMHALIDQMYPLERIGLRHPGDTAHRWRYRDGQGEIGFIASVTEAFCGDCTRLRLSTEGRLYTCLFAHQGADLRSLLRSPELDDQHIADRVATLWEQRSDRYSQLRSSAGNREMPETASGPASRIEMSYIGG